MRNLRDVFRTILNIYDGALSCLYLGRNAPSEILGKVLNMALQPRFLICFLCLDTWMNIQTFCLSSEIVHLLCSRDVNQKNLKIFHWFPNHLPHTDHGNINFLYIYTIKMQKSSLWNISRWNARLIYYINKFNNKNNNKNQDSISKVFEKFLLSEAVLSNK